MFQAATGSQMSLRSRLEAVRKTLLLAKMALSSAWLDKHALAVTTDGWPTQARPIPTRAKVGLSALFVLPATPNSASREITARMGADTFHRLLRVGHLSYVHNSNQLLRSPGAESYSTLSLASGPVLCFVERNNYRVRVRPPIVIGQIVHNALLRHRFVYTVNHHCVVVAEEHSTSFHCATDSRVTWSPFRSRDYIRAGSSLVETRTFSQAIGTCLDELHASVENGVERRQRNHYREHVGS
jgi:hypothetical protein